MTRYHAAWVLPISRPPIRDGWVVVQDARVVGCGAVDARQGHAADRDVDLGDVAILPGLVNAHTHLELSYLRDQVPPASSFTMWVRHIIAERRKRQHQPGRDPMVVAAIDTAIDESLRCGTAVVGEITNGLFLTYERLAASRLAGVVFWELIGFNLNGKFDEMLAQVAADISGLPASDTIRPSLAAHAPYSVAPGLLRSIRQAMVQMPSVPCSVHLAEGLEEVELLKTGGGPWKALMKDIGSWNHEWSAPGVGPVQYLDDLGFLGDRVLAVHCVQLSGVDLQTLKERGVTVVTCPRSNGHTGAGVPPLTDFYRSGVGVAVGTDSLASAPDLNVFSELAAMHALAPSVPAGRLIESATLQGARALGFGRSYGSIDPGKSARLITVDVPVGAGDVEEYLVSGIQPEQIRWIE